MENEDWVYTRLCIFLSEAPFVNMGEGGRGEGYGGGRRIGEGYGVKGREREEGRKAK